MSRSAACSRRLRPRSRRRLWKLSLQRFNVCTSSTWPSLNSREDSVAVSFCFVYSCCSTWEALPALFSGSGFLSFWKNSYYFWIIMASSLRRQVLSAYKQLHRARMTAFANDEVRLDGSRAKIREEFEKNRNLTDEAEIRKLVKHAELVADILVKRVVQVENVAEDRVALRLRPDNLVDVQACYKPSWLLLVGRMVRICVLSWLERLLMWLDVVDWRISCALVGGLSLDLCAWCREPQQ